MKELRLDDKLNFVEEPVEIMDREVRQLKQSRIPIVKVRWNSKRGREFTWEREDQIRATFVPKDSEIEKEVKKRSRFNFQQKSSKNRSREDTDEDNAKKQKLEDDVEKKELRDSMDVVPRDDIAIDVESLATKYPIVDWKTHVLTENMMMIEINSLISRNVFKDVK
ncbi:hypothetical protein Tco_1116493 [Tanacetum coccineum]